MIDRFTLHAVAAPLAGEDDERARRSGGSRRESTEETVRRAIQSRQQDWSVGGSTDDEGEGEATTG